MHYYILWSLIRKSTKCSVKPVDSEAVMVYNGLLTRLIESERRQRSDLPIWAYCQRWKLAGQNVAKRFGWFANLPPLSTAVYLSECRQRSDL